MTQANGLHTAHWPKSKHFPSLLPPNGIWRQAKPIVLRMSTTTADHNGDHEAKRARVEPGSGPWPTDPRFLQAMLSTRVDRFFSPGDVIFVADRDNRVIDVWKASLEACRWMEEG